MLSRDFTEFIEFLNANSVRYLLVGGYADALHGYASYTKDLDIWLDPSAQNAQNVVNAPTEFGFGSLNITAEDLLEEDNIIQLRYTPNRIDSIKPINRYRYGVHKPNLV